MLIQSLPYHTMGAPGVAEFWPPTDPVGAHIVRPQTKGPIRAIHVAPVGRDDPREQPHSGCFSAKSAALRRFTGALLAKHILPLHPRRGRCPHRPVSTQNFQKVAPSSATFPCFKLKLREDHLRGAGPEASRTPARYQPAHRAKQKVSKALLDN